MPAPRWLIVILKVVLILVALAAGAGAYVWYRLQHVPDRKNLRAQVDRTVETALAEHGLGTVAVAVYRDGRLYTRRYGPHAGGPSDTVRFEIGSITKVFTTLTAQALVANGTWRWSDPIWPLLPADLRPATDDGTTLEMLATHTSGLPRLPSSWFARLDEATDPYAGFTSRDVFAAYASGEDRTPWASATDDYSNLGMGLLGHVMERRTGETYDALVQRVLLGPLGMHQTRITLSEAEGRQLVPGRDETGAPASPWTFGALEGAGAYRSTIEDMGVFLRAAVERTPVPHLDWETTWAPRRSAAGETVALGWQLDALTGRLSGVRRVVWHNGGTGGYSSWLGFDPERRIGVVVLAARSSPAVDELGFELLLDTRYASFEPDGASPAPPSPTTPPRSGATRSK